MEIPFRGQYDKKMFYRGVRLANSPGRSGKLMNWIVVFALGAVIFSTYSSWVNMQGEFSIWLLVLASAFLSFYVGQAVLLPFFAARKIWSNPAVQRPLQGTITKQGIVYQLPTGKKEISWKRFRRIRKSNEMAALITQEGLMLLFPRYFFKKETDWEKFVNMLDQKNTLVR